MKISLSTFINNKESLEDIMKALTFSKTIDDEIIFESDNPFDCKIEYNDGFERMIPIEDVEFFNLNLLTIGDTVKVYIDKGNMFMISNDINNLTDFLNSIYELVGCVDKYSIKILENHRGIATIRVDYNDPLNSYIELY